MRRREVLRLAGAAAAAIATRPAGAAAVPIIGVLTNETEAGPRREVDALLRGLRELGYVPGKNIEIVYRWGARRQDRLMELARELVTEHVAVIVALAPPEARAAKAATDTIPIVMRYSSDPAKAGLVASLARPGGNVTGVSSVSGELYGKRLELLKQLVPAARRIAVLWHSQNPSSSEYLGEARAAAPSLGLELASFAIVGDDLAAALAAIRDARVDAFLPLRDPLIVRRRRELTAFALDVRLPAIYDDREFVDEGGLAAYGADLNDLHRRAAIYVDKILKGAKPAELPVEQPTKFELVINLKTAKALDLAVPPSLLARADEVIE